MESDERAYSMLAERERDEPQRKKDRAELLSLIKQHRTANPGRAAKLLKEITRMIRENMS